MWNVNYTKLENLIIKYETPLQRTYVKDVYFIISNTMPMVFHPKKTITGYYDNVNWGVPYHIINVLNYHPKNYAQTLKSAKKYGKKSEPIVIF